MELKKLRGKLATARRGHKLLKDKCDELMRQFLDIVREAKVLREEIAKKLSGISSEFRRRNGFSNDDGSTHAAFRRCFR